jgi:hypothetical protein
MQAIGHPIIGDTIYGIKNEIHSLCLHCAEMEVPLYANREKIMLKAPLPDLFNKTMVASGIKNYYYLIITTLSIRLTFSIKGRSQRLRSRWRKRPVASRTSMYMAFSRHILSSAVTELKERNSPSKATTAFSKREVLLT